MLKLMIIKKGADIMEHEEAFKNAIEEVIKHGYYYSYGSHIFRYNFSIDDFENVEDIVLFEEFKEYYLNQFEIPNNLHGYRTEDIIKELPKFEDIKPKFYSYKRYKEARANRINFNELEKDLKPYLEMNDDMKEEIKFPHHTNKDILYLINNDIFTDGTRDRNGILIIYKYDPDNKKFIKVTAENIFNFINVNPENENVNYWLDSVPSYIYFNNRLCKEKKLVHLRKIIPDFIKYYEVESILRDAEPSFKEMLELINSFKP